MALIQLCDFQSTLAVPWIHRIVHPRLVQLSTAPPWSWTPKVASQASCLVAVIRWIAFDPWCSSGFLESSFRVQTQPRNSHRIIQKSLWFLGDWVPFLHSNQPHSGKQTIPWRLLIIYLKWWSFSILVGQEDAPQMPPWDLSLFTTWASSVLLNPTITNLATSEDSPSCSCPL